MKYKIDTRENFDVISFENGIFDSILAEEMEQLVAKNVENGRSLIIDFSSIISMDSSEVMRICAMHNKMYQENLSFAICNLNLDSKKIFEGIEDAENLNMVPTQIEAIDLVSMEGLERELLFGDDEDL